MKAQSKQKKVTEQVTSLEVGQHFNKKEFINFIIFRLVVAFRISIIEASVKVFMGVQLIQIHIKWHLQLWEKRIIAM
jgi:hypothetical protein